MYRFHLTNSEEIAVVDSCFKKLVNQLRWHLTENGHVRSTTHPQIYLHDLVMERKAPKGYMWDHKNGDKLNNRGSNLRLATPGQNGSNRPRCVSNKSGFKGVSLHRTKWLAQIRSDGKVIHLGCFDDPIKAARVYDKAAKKYHGEFASTNFPMRFPRLKDV